MKLFLSFILSFFILSAFAQNVPSIKPNHVDPITEEWDLSLLPKWQEFTNLVKAGETDESKLSKYYDLFYRNEDDSLLPWDVSEAGCSWYCGANYETEVSSFLPSSKGLSYSKNELFDEDLTTAWIEGVAGYGIGESLSFILDNESPRITTCYIYNGYSKTKTTWKNNSRVKTFNVYENDELIATMHLEDIRGQQSFELPRPIGRRSDGQKSVLKFVIAEVYKGDKYDDTAISEFSFSGLDVHCLAEGSKVLMADGVTTKNIEDIEIGDSVMSYNSVDSLFLRDVVTKVHHTTHSKLLKLSFLNGVEILTTPNHPFLINRGWATFDLSDVGDKSNKCDIACKYLIEDLFAAYSKDAHVVTVELLDIEHVNQETETYTLELNGSGGFIVNGFIVGQE